MTTAEKLMGMADACARVGMRVRSRPTPKRQAEAAAARAALAEAFAAVELVEKALGETVYMLEDQYRQALGMMSNKQKDEACRDHVVLKVARAALLKLAAIKGDSK